MPSFKWDQTFQCTIYSLVSILDHSPLIGVWKDMGRDSFDAPILLMAVTVTV